MLSLSQNNVKLFLRLTFIFLSFTFSNAQNNFFEVIQKAEQKFDVKFSYVDSAIELIEFEEAKEIENSENIEEFINFLNNTTYLNLVRIDDRYIAIAPKKNLIRVCGYLLDEEKKPLTDANIIVIGKSKGTVSDSLGFFELDKLLISDVIEITHLSHNAQIKSVNGFYSNEGDCKHIILNQNNIDLEPVLVTNYILKSLKQQADGEVKLNTNSFGTLGGQVEPDLLQTSQIFPGVESHDESVANLNVRHGASDQNTIYWDNIKMYHFSHFFGLISAINPYLTKNISIVKGGTSAKYNDGVSSTYFLETDSKINDSITGGIGANLISVDGFLKIPVSKKVQINASVRRSVNDIVNTPTYTSYFDKTFQNNNIGNNPDATSFNFYNINLHSNIHLNDKQRLGLNFITINNNLEHQENSQTNLLDQIKQNTIAIGLAYDLKILDNFNFNLNLYRSEYELESRNYQNQQLQLLEQKNEVIENAVKSTFIFQPNKNHSLELGYQLNETGVLSSANVDDPFFIRIQKGVMINHSGFGEYTFSKNKFFARFGLRYNYFDKIQESTIEPRLNLRYNITNSLGIIGRYEKKSQYTSQVIDFLDDFLGIENSRWVLSDEQIPLVKSNQISGGLHYNKNKLLVDLTLFTKETEGILISGQGFQNQITDRRLSGTQRANGIELLINKRFKKLNIWSGYTFSKSELLFGEINPSYFDSNNDIRHSNTSGVTYALNKALNFSLVYNIKSGKPYSIPVEGEETTQNGSFTVVNYDNLNSKRLPSYNRLDFSVSYKTNINQKYSFEAKVGIFNILNRNQSLQRYYIVDDTSTNNVKEVNVQSLRLTPNIGLRFLF